MPNQGKNTTDGTRGSSLRRTEELEGALNEVIPTTDVPSAPRVRRLRSYNDLIAFLVDENIAHRANPASFTVQIATTPPVLPGVAFVRWVEKVPFVQVMQPIVTSVPEDRIHDVETAISHINDEAMTPGYGFSYEDRFIYYRVSLPIYDGEISSDVLQRAVTAVLDNARQLEPAFKKVVDGAPGASVLDYLVHN